MKYHASIKKIFAKLGLAPFQKPERKRKGFAHARGSRTHVIILDGTMSTLSPGFESNAGLAFKLINEMADPTVTTYYEAGLQWPDWRSTHDIISGKGINRQIRRAYGYLASRYHVGDRIILLGYSRGAFAVRSLAGVIDRVGLLRASQATERNVEAAYRHYSASDVTDASKAFSRLHCHASVEIEMVGVWDTVKALGIIMPVLWRLSVPKHAFHDHSLGPATRHGYHALAFDETRVVYNRVLWKVVDRFDARVQQVWFRGNHADVGGNLGGHTETRPLSNIPLVWMLEKLQRHGVDLPKDWRSRYPMDVTAPSTGNWRGWTKLFLSRRRRKILNDPSESLHPTLVDYQNTVARAEPLLE